MTFVRNWGSCSYKAAAAVTHTVSAALHFLSYTLCVKGLSQSAAAAQPETQQLHLRQIEAVYLFVWIIAVFESVPATQH